MPWLALREEIHAEFTPLAVRRDEIQDRLTFWSENKRHRHNAYFREYQKRPEVKAKRNEARRLRRKLYGRKPRGPRNTRAAQNRRYYFRRKALGHKRVLLPSGRVVGAVP